MKKLVILGQGGYAMTVKDVAEQLKYEIIAMLDDKDAIYPLSSFVNYLSADTYFIPAFGNNEFRLNWIKTLKVSGAKIATLIHPKAYVSPNAKIGEGCVALPGAIINTGTEIMCGCILNLGCIVDYDCIIEEGCHICLGAIVKGENRISTLTKIDAGQVVEARKYPV